MLIQFSALLTFGAEDVSRLGIFVRSQATKGLVGTIYYRSPWVECWLDDKIIYDGPIKKGGENTRIFQSLIKPGKHQIKIRWKVRVRGDEATRIKLGGRRIVNWVVVPEEGYAEYNFQIEKGRTKAIHAVVFRRFGLLENPSEIKFREVLWEKERNILLENER